MRVIWTDDRDLEPCRSHGVNFMASGDRPDPDNILAKVDGFGWLNDSPAEVEVFVRSPDERYSAAFLGGLREEIGAFLACPWKLTGGPDSFKGWASADLYVCMNC